MTTPRIPGTVGWASVALAAALLSLQAGDGGVPGSGAGTAGAALAGALIALIAWRRGRLQRPAWLLLAVPCLLAAAWFAARPVASPDPEAWEQDQRRRLEPVLAAVETDVESLHLAVAGLAERAAADDDALDDDAWLARLAEGWDAADGGRFPLSLCLWRGGERVAWTATLDPYPAADLPEPGDPAQVRRGRTGWVWHGALPGGRGRLEWQVGLTSPDRPRSDRGVDIRTSIVFTTHPEPTRWRGDPMRGLRATSDVVLDPVPGDMELPVLRTTVSGRPLEAQRAADAAERLILTALLLGAALLVWTAAAWRGGRLVVAAWIVRVCWAAADLFHWLPLALDPGRGAARPGDPASLIDPTYFATSWGMGLFASTLDALLTGVLIAVTAVASVRWLHARDRDHVPGGAQGLVHEVLYGVGAALVLALLWALADELAVNAHPRLIGPKVPFRAMTFWGLHVVLLTVGGGAVLLAAVLAGRRRGERSGLRTVVALTAAVAGGFALGRVGLDLGPLGLAALPLVVLTVRATSGLVVGGDRALRRLAWLLPLFAAVTWNYMGLAQAYRDVEDRWLARKLEELAAPREDWIEFLMEDLLSEMASDEAVLQDAPAAHAPEADELWRDWPAYALWRGAGVSELGMPCLVEILEPDGTGLSRFASGQFRDFGYEIVDRSEWRKGRPVSPRPDLKLDLYLQTEQRRYATGDEWILRGEVSRLGSEGWVALELPVRSGRVRTLREALAPGAVGGDSDGYVPRQDVDRPVVLLRSRDGRWDGAVDGLEPALGPRALAAEMERSPGDPVAISAGGRQWRSLWRPDGGDTAGPADGLLLGVRTPGAGERLLDLSRLILLDLLLVAAVGLLPVVLRLATGRWKRASLGLQERFLAMSFLLGLLPLVMAGTFIDRISREWLTDDARQQTRVGLETAREQLQGLLAEQARALAGSDYISDLLDSRLAGQRPLGPFGARQAMVFSADGELLLDETLSDLDDDEAALLLERARAASLVVMRDDQSTYLGTVIPVALESVTDVEQVEGMVGTLPGPGLRQREGFFFYRQRIDADLLVGLGEVIQGEATLYVEGEALMASHPEHVFAGDTDLILPPDRAARLDGRDGQLRLVSDGGRDLSWTGLLGLPVLRNLQPDGRLTLGESPAVLAASFPARGRDYEAQRERTVLFLAGLATLIFLLATVLGMVLSWRIFDPVRVLVTATRRLAAGDPTAPLPPPAADELGTLSAAFGAMRDDLSTARTALEERERFLARLLERVPVGVAVFDGDGRIVTVNPAARTMIDAFYADPDSGVEDRASRLLAAFRQAVGSDLGEAELVAPEGARTLRGRLAPLELPGGRSDRMIVFEDVTEFLETKRLAINAQLARQVAHEVKNPLTPIQLSVQFLEQAWRDGADDMDRIVSSTVNQVLEQVELLRSIATEFSLLGRPEALVREALDPAVLVDEVVSRYRTPDDDGGFDVTVSGDAPPPVLAHGESLAKVVANLMENSLQAVGDGGRLALEIAWSVDEREVTLAWRDNGPGLPPDVADRLFDLYFSTKSHGTGLGLPICRNLLSRMNGRINLADHADGGGAEAVVVLERAVDSRPEDA